MKNTVNTKNILNAIIYVLLVMALVIIGIKLVIFLFPFVIAYLIYYFTRPIQRLLTNKLKIKSKLADIISISLFYILLVVFFGIIIYYLILQLYLSFQPLLEIFNKIQFNMNNILDNLKKVLPIFIFNIVIKLKNSVFTYIIGLGTSSLTFIKVIISKFPVYIVYTVITILASFLMSENKVYMLDVLNEQLPKVWIDKMIMIKEQVINMLFGYFKAQAIIILICFLEMNICLFVINKFVFQFNYVLLAAFVVAFIDALPILGAGAVLIPAAIIAFSFSNIPLAISLIVTYIVATISRQTLEPKLISNNIGANPLLTLISMYAGFKLIGVFGFIIGPMVMLVFKIIFSKELEYGFFKFLANEEK